MRDNKKIKYLFFSVLFILYIILLHSCRKDENTIITEEPQRKWKNLATNITNNIKGLYFINEFTGYAAGNSFPNDSSKIIKTTDGGLTWFPSLVNVTDASLSCIVFINDNTGFAAGNGETIIKTTDAGNSWSISYFTGINAITCIDFFDSNNGIAAGYNGVLLKTGNGGASWQTVSVITPGNLYSFSKANSQGEAFTCGDFGLIYYTNDYGNSWQRQYFDQETNFRSVSFPAPDTGYCCGKNGVVFKTTNKGVNWIQLNNNLDVELTSSCFTDVRTGYFTSDQGIVYKTRDGCSSLYRTLTETQNYLRKVIFIGQLKGWAAGETGTIIFTDSGGE